MSLTQFKDCSIAANGSRLYLGWDYENETLNLFDYGAASLRLPVTVGIADGLEFGNRQPEQMHNRITKF